MILFYVTRLSFLVNLHIGKVMGGMTGPILKCVGKMGSSSLKGTASLETWKPIVFAVRPIHSFSFSNLSCVSVPELGSFRGSAYFPSLERDGRTIYLS